MLSVNRQIVLMLRVIAPFYKTLARSSNTLVEYSFRHPKVDCSNPATTACTGREKMASTMCRTLNLLQKIQVMRGN